MVYHWYLYCAGGCGGQATATTEAEYQDAATIAYAHKFDDGVIEIITPPESDVTVQVLGHTVAFLSSGKWEIN